MYQVNIYGVKNIHNKSDDAILREYARKQYKKVRDSLKKYSTYKIMGEIDEKEYQDIKEKEKMEILRQYILLKEPNFSILT